MIKVVSRPFLGKEKYKDFRLCYVDSIPETVYELPPESKAWERTAEYRAIKMRLEEEVKQGLRNSIYDMDSPFYIRRDGFYVKLPRDYAYDNSPFCVRDINAGAVAWIFARGLRSKRIDGVAIQAGANPYEFFERVDRINEMYPYEPEEDDEL